jgi:long-chain fatty acid transport protein
MLRSCFASNVVSAKPQRGSIAPAGRLGLVMVITVAARSVQADGFRVPYQGAAAAGQAEAFSAQADDPSAIFYNPAGMTQLRGWQLNVGSNLVSGETEFTGPNGAKAYGDLAGRVAVPPPSNFYVTANLRDLGIDRLGDMTVGLGVAAPFGLINDYPKDGPFSDVVIRTKLPLMAIKPTIAYRLADWASVGFGADIYTFASFLGEGQFQQQRRLDTGGAGELNGSGTALGYNLSLMLTPLRSARGKPQLNLGVVYRSQTNLPLGGHTVTNGQVAEARMNVPLPEVVTGAIAYWPVRSDRHEWKLEYDMDFVGWDRFRSFDVYIPGVPVSVTPQEWGSIWTASAGTEFRWLAPETLPQWDIALRGGYQHSNTPVPDYTFSPTVPDSNWDIVAVGLGFTCRRDGRFLGLVPCGSDESTTGPKSIGVDLAFQAAFFDPRTISENYRESVEGRYESRIYVGSVNFRVAF